MLGLLTRTRNIGKDILLNASSVLSRISSDALIIYSISVSIN